MRGRVGASMQIDRARVRYVPKRGRAPRLTMDDMPRVRKELRTTKGLTEIARDLGISVGVLEGFIKRHNLCHLKERTQMNRLLTGEVYQPDYGTDRWKLKDLKLEWEFADALAARNK